MLNPFESPHLDEYLRRLNLPLKQMPAQDRAELYQELRQHLDALVAAYQEAGCTPDEALEAALRRFGEPGQIGKRLLNEWRAATAPRDRSDFRAVLFALAMYPVAIVLAVALVECCAFVDPGGYRWHGDLAAILTAFGAPALAGGVTGWRLRQRGVVGMFYAMVALLAFLAPFFATDGLTYVIAWLGWGGVSAYLGSACRNRGFYHFPFSLLKLRLK